jgi:ketosteroid isomerase-like protein
VFGEWAYCWNKLSVIVTPLKGGATIKRAGDALSIPRKQAGKWVIYRDANRLAAVP